MEGFDGRTAAAEGVLDKHGSVLGLMLGPDCFGLLASGCSPCTAATQYWLGGLLYCSTEV